MERVKNVSPKQKAQHAARERNKYRARLQRQDPCSSPGNAEVDAAILKARVDRVSSVLPKSSSMRSNTSSMKALLVPGTPVSAPWLKLPSKAAFKRDVMWLPVDEQDIKHSTPTPSASPKGGTNCMSSFLNKELWCFTKYISLTTEEKKMRESVLQDLQAASEARLASLAGLKYFSTGTKGKANVAKNLIQVNAFGSFACDMSTFQSDIDVTIEGFGLTVSDSGAFKEEAQKDEEDEEDEEDGEEERGPSIADSSTSIASEGKRVRDDEDDKSISWVLDRGQDSKKADYSVIDLTEPRSWNNTANAKVHLPLRKKITDKIFDILMVSTATTTSRETLADLPQTAADIETLLYTSSHSEEEYADESSLADRVAKFWHEKCNPVGGLPSIANPTNKLYISQEDVSESESESVQVINLVESHTEASDSLEVGFHTGAEAAETAPSSQQKMMIRAISESTISKKSKNEQLSILHTLHSFLRQLDWNVISELRARAKVPIITLHHRLNIQCDISLGVSGSTHTKQVKELIALGKDAFFPLTSLVKVLLGQMNLDKPFNGGIGSYKIYVMVAHLLKSMSNKMHKPASLRKPDLDLGYLLIAFFKYYGVEANLNRTTELRVGSATTDFFATRQVVSCQKLFSRAATLLQTALINGVTSLPNAAASSLPKQPLHVQSSSLLALIIDAKKLKESRLAARLQAESWAKNRNSSPQGKLANARDILGEINRHLLLQGTNGYKEGVTFDDVQKTSPLLFVRLMSFQSKNVILAELKKISKGDKNDSNGRNNNKSSNNNGINKRKGGNLKSSLSQKRSRFNY